MSGTTPPPPPPTQGESEADNSNSSANYFLNSMIAEKGTGGTGSEALEEEFEESSIEALNWSEADEEELQMEQKLRKAKGVGGSSFSKKNKKVLEALKNNETSIEGELAAASAEVSISTDSDLTVRMLSSSLLQSINSDIEEESVNRKNKVIESWASDVKSAVDRGEMEIQEDEEEVEEEEEEEDDTVNDEGNGLRKRKNMNEDKMTASFVSGLTSEVDPLSNAPVLDDGPIWNKGPKRYRFEENRRINQKLTFCVLITIVLAIGLGLGNLVAYNECETEYKAAILKGSPIVVAEELKNGIPPKGKTDEKKDDSIISPIIAKTSLKPDIALDREQYAMQMQTLSKIVKTLDNLQMKIDKFENKSRQMGGVVVLEKLEDEERFTETPIIDEEDEDIGVMSDVNYQEDEFISNLIDGIEESVDYFLKQDELEYLEQLQKSSKFFKDPSETALKENILAVDAAIAVMKRANDEFIQKERGELGVKKILGLAEDRQSKDYSNKERAEVKEKFDKFMEEYPFKTEMEVETERLKFVKKDNGDNNNNYENDFFDSLEEDIEGFFKRYNHEKVELTEDLDFNAFTVSGSQSDEKFEEPKEDDDQLPFVSNIPTQEDAKKIRSLKQYSKKKKSKPDNEEDLFGSGSGSGGGGRSKSKKRNKENNQKRDKQDKKEKKQKKKYQNEKPPPKGNFKGYDLNNNWDVDNEDDDDHKRKKYHSKSGEDYHNNLQNGGKKSQEDINWMLERTKIRNDIRSKSQQHQHSSTGKNKNWQVERDLVRERFRSKNEKKKETFDY